MTNTATPKQVAFLDRLAVERGQTVPDSLSVKEASALISQYLALPKVIVAPATPATERVTEQGIYRNAQGEVYKVRRSKNTGNLYAERLVITDNAGRFEYAMGAVRALTPADRLTLDEAKAFGIQYGMCIVCGKTLTDPKSIAQGIGPVCIKRV